MVTSNPILVEQRRGELAESWHRGAVAIVDEHGQLLWGAGDIDRPLLVNSSLKLLQALPFLTTGAADRWVCTDAEIVLAASSQSGRRFQRNALKVWLARIGLSNSARAIAFTGNKMALRCFKWVV